MEFPIAVHKDDGSVYGVTVPDIPGVHSWGETIDDAIKNTREAIVGHVETLIELGTMLNSLARRWKNWLQSPSTPGRFGRSSALIFLSLIPSPSGSM